MWNEQQIIIHNPLQRIIGSAFKLLLVRLCCLKLSYSTFNIYLGQESDLGLDQRLRTRLKHGDYLEPCLGGLVLLRGGVAQVVRAAES